MTQFEIIKQLCDEKGISVYQLEKDMGFGNGTLAKSKMLSSDRVYRLAQYFHKPMEYFMTGTSFGEVNAEMERLKHVQSILTKINVTQNRLLALEDERKQLEKALEQLQEEYEKLGSDDT